MNALQKLLLGQLVILLLSTPTLAQETHVVDRADLATSVIEHWASRDVDRAAIEEVLRRPEVQEIAATTGFDLDHLIAAVGTMEGADLERAATSARQLNDTLVGGQSTVTISTTAIIIGLLVLILIIVAV